MTVSIQCPVCQTAGVVAEGRWTPEAGGYWQWNWLHRCDSGRGSRAKDDYQAIVDALDAEADGVSCRLGASLRALDVVRYATEPDTSSVALRAPEGLSR